MGAGASSSLGTQIEAASNDELKAAIAALPEEARNKLVSACEASQEIPINAVARVYRGKVKDEATALQLDALLNDMQAKLASNKDDAAKGFVKMVRTVCKTEWAYEALVVWATHADFQAYQVSALRKEVNGLFEEKAQALYTDYYRGARVYDRLQGEITEGSGTKLTTDGEIPINIVARVNRGNCKNEGNALQLDALLNGIESKLAANKDGQAKGFLKVVRTVCKTEWAYDAIIVWSTFADFQAYKATELRKEVNTIFEEKCKPLLTDYYSGVRVYDEM